MMTPENQVFFNEVVAGLTSSPKTLPSKYFYDAVGDALFVDIMNSSEYYLTDCERQIFQNQATEIIDSWNIEGPLDLIELGAGDGSKTKFLLQELIQRDLPFVYRPIDISDNALQGLKTRMLSQWPSLQIEPLCGDYFKMLEGFRQSNAQKVILFLGSNLGNMTDPQAEAFLSKIAQNMQPKDCIQLGVDLIKPSHIILPAYNDSKGITARFNLNLLHRINQEFGANFELEHWEHCPEYDESSGIARSFLRSKKGQSIHFPSHDNEFHFHKGEKIKTEISRKYNSDILENILKESTLKIHQTFLDDQHYFANYILKPY